MNISKPTSLLGVPPKASLASVCVLSFILSGCSLLYELLVAQTLSLMAGNMVVWYSVTIGTYLAAMGVGAILCGPPTESEDWSRLFRVEILLSLVGASAVILLNFGHFFYLFQTTRNSLVLGSVVFFGIWFAITFLIGILTGTELPLLIHLGNKAAAGTKVTNRVLGWDYIGALAAGITFPIYLVPFLDLHTIGFAIAALNLLIAAYILLRFLFQRPRTILKLAGCGAFAAVLVLGCLSARKIEQYALKKYYYYQEASFNLASLIEPMPELPDVFRESSPYQKIDIVRDPDPYDDFIEHYSSKFFEDPRQPKNHFLFLNGDFQFASNVEEVYHEWFAHVPIIMGGKVPERVLVLGGGDGLIHRELLKYKEIKSIVHVDIDQKLVDLAKTHPILRTMNQGSFHNPRVRSIFMDGFQYLRNYAGKKYDAIYMDFPDVMDYNLSKLYSREFYHFVRKRLADDGFAALDASGLYVLFQRDGTGRPIQIKHSGTWPIHSNTMRLAGFKTVLPFYSILEIDNRFAFDALSAQDTPTDLAEDGGAWKDEFLSEFSAQNEHGFIMLRKDRKSRPFKYVDFDVHMYLLNEKRFQLSYPKPPQNSDPIDLSKVNSILRPTLPNGGLWYIRSAW